jgi:hypothetical protein
MDDHWHEARNAGSSSLAFFFRLLIVTLSFSILSSRVRGRGLVAQEGTAQVTLQKGTTLTQNCVMYFHVQRPSNYLVNSTSEHRQLGGYVTVCVEMGTREFAIQHIRCAPCATPPAIALDIP